MTAEQAELQDTGTGAPEAATTDESALAEGFALAMSGDGTDNGTDRGTDVGAEAGTDAGAASEPATPDGTAEAEQPAQPDRPSQPVQPVQPVQEMPPQPTQSVAQPSVAQPPEEAAPLLEEVPENIRAEWDNLRHLSPEAARLALEDSPEGARLRSRLELYGADLTMDRAERVLELRERARMEAASSRRAVEEHNRNFYATLDSRVPDYAAMMRDPARAGELRAYQQEVIRWIESKPYGEGARLMRIAQYGKDAGEVAGLLESFARERHRARTPDPGGALAVPGRRGPAVAPAGLGDRDDWDAGFRLATADARA